MTEKHKLNVPETMTEVLDVSDEEGELCYTLQPVNINPFQPLHGKIIPYDTPAKCSTILWIS